MGSFDGNRRLSLTRRFYDANGGVTGTLELKPGVEQANAAYTSQQALVVSSMNLDLSQSIDQNGDFTLVAEPIKPIKTPCQKATNQLNRALAAYEVAAMVIDNCRGLYGYRPGVCLAELAAFEQAYGALVHASDNFNAVCLGI